MEQHSTIYRGRFHGRGCVVVEKAPFLSRDISNKRIPPFSSVLVHSSPFLLSCESLNRLLLVIRQGIKGKGKRLYYLEFGNNKDGESTYETNFEKNFMHARLVIITVEISNRCLSISVSIVVLVL